MAVETSDGLARSWWKETKWNWRPTAELCLTVVLFLAYGPPVHACISHNHCQIRKRMIGRMRHDNRRVRRYLHLDGGGQMPVSDDMGQRIFVIAYLVRLDALDNGGCYDSWVSQPVRACSRTANCSGKTQQTHMNIQLLRCCL